MFWGFPSVRPILVNATSRECSKGISSKLAQTSTWTEGWMFKNLGVFVHDHKQKKQLKCLLGVSRPVYPHRSALGETLTGNSPRPSDYSSSWQTRFHHRSWLQWRVDFIASSYAKSGLSPLHWPKNCSGWTLTVHAEPLGTSTLPRTLKSQ